MFKKAVSSLICLSLILSLCLTGCTKKESGPVNTPKNETENSGDSIVEDPVEDIKTSESEDVPDSEESSEPDETIDVGAEEENNDVDENAEATSGTVEFADAKVGDVVVFGAYDQDGDDANGAEPIEWEVQGKPERYTGSAMTA